MEILPPRPRPYNRSNLFLVRVWSGNVGDDATGESGKIEWSGKAQRIVTGETQLFTGLQGLVAVLETMLSNDTQQTK